MNDDLKTGIIGTREGPAVQDEAHLERCPICGAMFDKRYLDQALHHAMPHHTAIAVNDR